MSIADITLLILSQRDEPWTPVREAFLRALARKVPSVG